MADDADLEECAPLLKDSEIDEEAMSQKDTIARRYPLRETSSTINAGFESTEVFQISRFVNANAPWYLFVRSIALCAINMSTVAGAYFFVLADFQIIPRCYDLKLSWTRAIYCHVSSLCFCTYPLICMMVVVWVFQKNIVDSRLYYECLRHGIMLDFDNYAFWTSGLFWSKSIYGFVALSLVCFVGNEVSELSLWIFRSLTYIAPILSFAVVLGTQWQVENHLIPLPKFCEIDPVIAAEIIRRGKYVPDVFLHVAFHRVEERLRNSESKPIDSRCYFKMLLESVEDSMSSVVLGQHSREDLYSEWWFYEKIAASLGWPPVETYGDKLRIQSPERSKDPETHRLLEKASKEHGVIFGRYWVTDLLHSPHLDDDRARQFRIWNRAYRIFAFVVAAGFLWLYILTAITVMREQRIVPQSDPVTRELSIVSGSMYAAAKRELTEVLKNRFESRNGTL